jgi:hypothetical protein
MGINFPTTLDTDTELYQVTDSVDDVLADHHNTHTDALKAIEIKVGVDSSTVNTSLDYLIHSGFQMLTATKDTLAVTATDWSDYTGLTISVVLPITCDVQVIFNAGTLVHSGTAGSDYVQLYWGSALVASTLVEINEPTSKQTVSLHYTKPATVAGTYTCKIQTKVQAGTATWTNGTLSVVVHPA